MSPSGDQNLFGASCLVVAAHPDDEVIGIGGHLRGLGDVTIVHVTDGAPRDGAAARAAGCTSSAAFAAVRRREAEAALALAGIRPPQIQALDLSDQEAATALAELAWRLAALLRTGEFDTVVTHPYEGGHPDHDASAFAVHAAWRLLARAGDGAPAILEMTSYHSAGGRLQPGVFLPNPACAVTTLPLSEADRLLKRRMFACHATQRQTLALFPVDVERFRPAPRYDFTRPAHEGPLLYELFARPSMSRQRWCELARASLAKLDLSQPGG